MMVGIALSVVALVVIAFMTTRVMARKRPTAVRLEAPPEAPPRSPIGRPHYVARLPSHYALPPITIETLPINFKHAPEMVPPIDRGVLAALVASSSRTAGSPRPEVLARGSIPSADASDLDDAAQQRDVERFTSYSDLDGAETLRHGSDLDEDAPTRTNMSPVR